MKPCPRLLYQFVLLLLLTSLPSLAMDADILPGTHEITRVQARYGAAAAGRLQAWRSLAIALSGMPEPRQVEVVNGFFNRIPGRNDESLWGRRDHWATPMEMLIANGGDCEDYALAKFFTLRALGIANDKLRITYVRAWLRGEKRMEPHMVLAYYASPDADPLILDNLIDEVRPASAREDLAPTMGFNAEGLWSAKQRRLIGKPDDIGRWGELLSRMAGER